MSGVVVADSSVLIALDEIGCLDILRALFHQVVIPEAVEHETTYRHQLPEWIVVQPCEVLSFDSGQRSLGAGETEAISLALALKANWTLLDERAARLLAQSLGLQVVGTVGLLVAAKLRGAVPAVRPLLEDLSRSGFRLTPTLVNGAGGGGGATTGP